MKDGHVNKCKECNKNDVALHRIDNIEKIREYDRNRPNQRERAIKHKKRVSSMTSDERKESNRKKNLNFKKNPHLRNQKVVNGYLDNAVRDGRKEKPSICSECFRSDLQIQGHHPSYLRPLDVVWLCTRCHGLEHRRLNELKRR